MNISILYKSILNNSILMLRNLFAIAMAAATAISANAADAKLTGTVIGSTYSVDYRTGQKSTTVNTAADAFDGNLSTYFASYDRSYTWAASTSAKSM